MRLELLSVTFDREGGGQVRFHVVDGRTDGSAPLVRGEARFAIRRRGQSLDHGSDVEVVTLRGDPHACVVVTFHPPACRAGDPPLPASSYRRRAAILIANIAVNGRLSTPQDAPPIVVLGRR